MVNKRFRCSIEREQIAREDYDKDFQRYDEVKSKIINNNLQGYDMSEH